MFATFNLNPGSDKVKDEAFAIFCLSNPSVSSWISYFDDIEPTGEVCINLRALAVVPCLFRRNDVKVDIPFAVVCV